MKKIFKLSNKKLTSTSRQKQIPSRSMFFFGAILFFGLAPAAQSAVTMFQVDLSGVGDPSGHEIKVFGTVTLDPTQPVSDTTIVSALFLQHHTDPANPLPFVPNDAGSGPQASNLQWNLVGKDLYINRISNNSSGLRWSISTANGDETFILGSGNAEHFALIDTVDGSDAGFVGFKSPSGPDGPMGFLVGTVVPEPSSTALLGLGSLALVLRRRR